MPTARSKTVSEKPQPPTFRRAMIDLSNLPTMALFEEIERRENALSQSLAEIKEWRFQRTDSGISPECSSKGRAIVTEVALAFGVTVEDIMGRSKVPKITKARSVAMVALRQQNFSLHEVGRFFDRDHGTILHAMKTVKHNP